LNSLRLLNENNEGKRKIFPVLSWIDLVGLKSVKKKKPKRRPGEEHLFGLQGVVKIELC
jgi:hypothetical protein